MRKEDGVTYLGLKDMEDVLPDPSVEGNGIEGPVVVEDGVTVIPDEFFKGQNGITSVTLPDSVEEIGASAFGDCDALEQVQMPEDLQIIGEKAFQGCRQLKEITVPGSVRDIPNSAFAYCHSLTDVELQDGVGTIGIHAFDRCDSLQSIALPDSAKTIGVGAFGSCESLKEVRFPEGLETVDRAAFLNCDSLERADFSGGVETIGKHAFDNCRALKEVKLPESGTCQLDDTAFTGCKSLSYENLPENVMPFTIIVPESRVSESVKERTVVDAVLGQHYTDVVLDYQDPAKSGKDTVTFTVEQQDVRFAGTMEDGTRMMSIRMENGESYTCPPGGMRALENGRTLYSMDGRTLHDIYESAPQTDSPLAKQDFVKQDSKGSLPITVTEKQVFDMKNDDSKKIVSIRDPHSASGFGSFIIDAVALHDAGKESHGTKLKRVDLDPDETYSVSEQRGKGENRYFYHKQMSGQEVMDLYIEGKQASQKAKSSEKTENVKAAGAGYAASNITSKSRGEEAEARLASVSGSSATSKSDEKECC